MACGDRGEIMIFQQWREILNGTKTQTRRIVKLGERALGQWGHCAYGNGLCNKTGEPIDKPSSAQDQVPCHSIGPDDPCTGQLITIDSVWHDSGRLKWAIGNTYAVVPKRTEGAIWWRDIESAVYYEFQQKSKDGWHHDELEDAGYQQLRIRITDIRQEYLRNITEEDAVAEGCCASDVFSAVDDYVDLWENINNRPDVRWDDNPLVWVLTFELAETAREALTGVRAVEEGDDD